jgi:hypothetical protein
MHQHALEEWMHITYYTWDQNGLQSHRYDLPPGTFGVAINDQIEGHDVEVVYDDEMPSVELTLDGASVKDFDALASDVVEAINRRRAR